MPGSTCNSTNTSANPSPNKLNRNVTGPLVNQHIAVIGAGLAGTMMAALLDKLGFEVTIFERRHATDMEGKSAKG